MTTTAAWPRPRPDVSSLVVERPNRASIATRIAHPLLRGTIGLGLATLARTGGHQLRKAYFTETLDDAVDSYRYLLEQGFRADRIIVSGDSARTPRRWPYAAPKHAGADLLSDARAAIHYRGKFHQRVIADAFRLPQVPHGRGRPASTSS
ncbi:hypothetical protein OHB12_12395 [Nocardia sp. NBC_01730]|uniref:hypothetical protein n=1 Tax=Nocardia sp. NBC_01730 TaxID=2975998 RepID=UPI002E153C23|nr:hypothetical protein OHB12_12395 [Nocardia sp. NBC_01730]